MLDRSEVGKRGYLNEDYRLFHLRDSRALALDYHYHEFDKLVFQLGGRATYNIEGKSYPLQPMDILLVSRNLIHLPVVDPGQVYERMVLWMDRSFLARFSAPETDLAACFELSASRAFHLYRPRGEARGRRLCRRAPLRHLRSPAAHRPEPGPAGGPGGAGRRNLPL